MENRDRKGGSSSSRVGAKSATKPATMAATVAAAAAAAPSTTATIKQHQRNHSSSTAPTTATAPARIATTPTAAAASSSSSPPTATTTTTTRPRASTTTTTTTTAATTARDYRLSTPHPPSSTTSTSRQQRPSSSSSPATGVQPSSSAGFRVAQRSSNPFPLVRSATAPSRHDVVTAIHTDREASSTRSTRSTRALARKAPAAATAATPATPATPATQTPSRLPNPLLVPTASKLQQQQQQQQHHPQGLRRHTASVTTTTSTSTSTSSSFSPQQPSTPATTTAAAATNNTTQSASTTAATTTTTTTNTKTIPPPPSSRRRDPPNSLSAPSSSSSRPAPNASARLSPTPPKKRAPAHFSSNGVATSGGPPPSLAYSRRFSMDNRGAYSTPSTPSSRAGRSSNQGSSGETRQLPTVQGFRDARRHSTTAMQRRLSHSSYDDDDDDDDDEDEDEYGERDRTIRGLEDLQNSSNGGAPAGNNNNKNKNNNSNNNNNNNNNNECHGEDVFLKLARSDTTTGRAADRLERRRARLSQYSSQYRNSLPAETQSSPVDSEFNSSPPQVSEEVWRRNGRMSSPADYRSRRMSQSSEHLVEERSSVTPRASFGARPQTILRRDNSPGHSRSFSLADARARSGLTSGALARGLSASPHIEDNSQAPLIGRDFGAPGSVHDDDDSASSVSTTAASSVWDELDDLKSRIRRLEVTGRIPASGAGNGSNSSGDRPRTATTTVTTVSSSPRHNTTGISPANSTFSGAPNNTTSHPLLHTALAKSKLVMPPDVYKHLELAAKDALDLANTVGAPGSGIPSQTGADRAVRRKADGVCRSLTELCLALSENKQSIAPAKHHSFIQTQFTASRPATRSLGESLLGARDRGDSVMGARDRGDSVMGDRLPPRAIGRFAERKGSMASLSVAAGYSPRSDPPISSPTTIGTMRHRSSMVLKDGFSEERERERFRAPSRAATEVNTIHHLPSHNGRHPAPREYTTQDINSTLPPRRGSVAPMGIQSSPLGPSLSKRIFTANQDSTLARTHEFNMSGGPINERLVNAANAAADMSTSRFRSGAVNRTSSRRLVRGLRDTSVDVDRPTALRRAEAATERLLRR